MAKSSKSDSAPTIQATTSELADALTQAIEAAKPPAKKTIFNRRKKTPWSPPPGEAKLKLKRKFFQHGIPLSEKRLTNEQIALCNKVRPGSYCDGFVTVQRRRDKGINIAYPVRTPQQRLKLVNQFGIRNFTELLQYVIKEAEMPKKSEFDLDSED